MQLKKTKKGKFSFDLDWDARQAIGSTFMDCLKDESVTLIAYDLSTFTGIRKHLQYSAAHQFFQRCSSQFFSPNRIEHFLLTRLDALVLLGFMGNKFNDNMELVNFRNALLKSLS